MSETQRPAFERDANGAVLVHRECVFEQILTCFWTKGETSNGWQIVHKIHLRPLPAGLPGAHINSAGYGLRRVGLAENPDLHLEGETLRLAFCLAGIPMPSTNDLLDQFIDPTGELSRVTAERRRGG